VADDAFLDPYFAEYRRLLVSDEVKERIRAFADIALSVRAAGAKMMFAGNGASASIAEHGAVDFTKQGRVRGVTFHDPNLMTCFANDFGYDHWMAKAIEHYADPGDVAVLISTSGRSPSVVHAAQAARGMGLRVVSFTGRDADNPLRAASDLAFWVPSHAYNVVENLHAIWLTATIDLVIGKAEYETRAVVAS
jgi:D-sedoheptulose 7-phosphate isomerase